MLNWPAPNSRSALVVAALREGARNRELAVAHGVSRAAITKIKNRAIAKGLIEDGRRPAPSAKSASEKLAAEAMCRNISKRALISEILRLVAEDNLFDAILGPISEDDE